LSNNVLRKIKAKEEQKYFGPIVEENFVYVH